MNATAFMAALNTVEQDHRVVLDNIQTLKDAVSRLLGAGDTDPTRILDQLREITTYFATQFEAHMEEEETTLFPVLDQHKPEGPDLVARLRQEHADIRRKREEFENCLQVADGLEGGAPKMVLVDLLAYGWDLWEFLDNHAHAETRAVHECLARSLLDPAASR
jgi:iron-sulfur cluster repair protein YtfE (RIC family)